MKPVYIPIVDACRIAGIRHRPLWERVVSGEVDAKRDGRSWLVNRADAERLRREREGAAA